MAHSCKLRVLVGEHPHELFSSFCRIPERLYPVLGVLLLVGFCKQDISVHHPLDDCLPHPLVLIGTLLFEEVHDLLPGQMADPLPLLQPDHPGAMEVSQPLENHLHVS